MASTTDALRDFLGPIMAEYARIIEEGPADMPVVIDFGGYKYETTLADFKALDKAHQVAFDRMMKAAETRAANKRATSFI